MHFTNKHINHFVPQKPPHKMALNQKSTIVMLKDK